MLERLDGELTHRELDQGDTDSVLEIIQALSEAARDWRSGMFQSVPMFDQAQVTIAPGVMARLALWRGVNIEVRAHIFRNSAETHIHDHGQNFISVCVDGAYQHNQWAVDPKAVGSHYMWNRAVGGALAPLGEVPGQVNMIATHTHANGLPLFVSKHCFHTIESSQARVVTITLRDCRKKTDPTSVLSPISSIETSTGKVRDADDYREYINSVVELVHVLANFSGGPASVGPAPSAAVLEPVSMTPDSTTLYDEATELFLDIDELEELADTMDEYEWLHEPFLPSDSNPDEWRDEWRIVADAYGERFDY